MIFYFCIKLLKRTTHLKALILLMSINAWLSEEHSLQRKYIRSLICILLLNNGLYCIPVCHYTKKNHFGFLNYIVSDNSKVKKLHCANNSHNIQLYKSTKKTHQFYGLPLSVNSKYGSLMRQVPPRYSMLHTAVITEVHFYFVQYSTPWNLYCNDFECCKVYTNTYYNCSQLWRCERSCMKIFLIYCTA